MVGAKCGLDDVVLQQSVHVDGRELLTNTTMLLAPAVVTIGSGPLH